MCNSYLLVLKMDRKLLVGQCTLVWTTLTIFSYPIRVVLSSTYRCAECLNDISWFIIFYIFNKINDIQYWLQICITTSTSGGLEQILPWLFYHKVIGVSNFFLFVEGKAASPGVAKVLQSIPVSSRLVLLLSLICYKVCGFQ